MEKLIPILDEMRNIMRNIGLSTNPYKLPLLVVVGSQSVGKSSLLERLVQKRFLPRGKGMVTRRPLQLQLVNIPEGSEEYAEFLGSNNRSDRNGIFKDFKKVEEEIIEITNQSVNREKDVKDDPIVLKICSPKVSTVTLVDLPGLIDYAMDDQPRDLKEKVQNMVKCQCPDYIQARKYIEPEESIILVVHSADNDIANCSAMKMAEEVDPHGERTIVVLTKIDMVEPGTDVLGLLLGKGIKKKLGVVGVRSSSTADLNKGLTMEEIELQEMEFFHTNDAYRQVASSQGIRYLSFLLTTELVKHINRGMPKIIHKINTEIEIQKGILDRCGEKLQIDEKAKTGLIRLKAQSFIKNLGEQIEGSHAPIESTKIVGGALISEIFYEKFPQLFIERGIELKNGRFGATDLRKSVIEILMKNAKGTGVPLFSSDDAFKQLVRGYIEKFREPCQIVTQEVMNKLLDFVEECRYHLTELDPRFPNLVNGICDEAMEFLQERLIQTKSMVDTLINMELAHINMNHIDAPIYQLKETENYETDPGYASEDSSTAEIGNKGPVRTAPPPPVKPVTQNNTEAANPFEESAPSEASVGFSVAPPSVAGTMYHSAHGGPPSESGASSSGAASGSQGNIAEGNSAGDFDLYSDMLKMYQQEDIKRLTISLRAYMTIVMKNCLDMIPKTIMLQMVNDTKEKLEIHICNVLERSEDEGSQTQEELFREAAHIEKDRETATQTHALLRSTLHKISGVRAQANCWDESKRGRKSVMMKH